jgi:putative membrane protein
MWGPSDGGWWGLGMMLVWLLFLALIVVGVVFLVRSFSDGGRTAPRPDDNRALDILDERFARGEVDQKEYEERRRILTGGR